MKTHEHELGTIHVPNHRDGLANLFRLADRSAWWSADTETTGLNAFAPGFRVRLVQFGTFDEAWVLNPEFPRHMAAIRKLLEEGPTTWWHNWLYDAVATEQSLGIDFDKLASRARCTDIVSRLVDPRPVVKGGTGHKLEQLTAHYLRTGAKKDTRAALHEAWGRKNKVKIADIFREVPVDLPEYEIYAGSDVLLCSRLAAVLDDEVQARPELKRLSAVEHPLSRRIASMQRIGMPFDGKWADRAEEKFDHIFEEAEEELMKKWKVDPTSTGNVHSSAASLKLRFADLGASLTKKTKPSKRHPEGQTSLDAEVLKELAQASGDVGELARTVLLAKRNKHYGDYIRTMRAELGVDGRIHPNVRPMQAATARMSVSNPPVQQFPRDDVDIRGCLLADDGEVIVAADYAQVEFRVGAAASQDPVLIRKIKNGEDLHAITATSLFGPGFTDNQRQASKPIGFGRLYLGGATGIRQQMVESDTTGHVPPLSAVKRAIAAFDREYKVYNRWAQRQKAIAEKNDGRIVTITGRPLIVEPAYAAANYQVQSAARDVFAAGITELHKRGMGDRLRLVVHDEVILTVAPGEAEEFRREVEDAMSTTLRGVPIVTESKVKGERWKK